MALERVGWGFFTCEKDVKAGSEKKCWARETETEIADEWREMQRLENEEE